ncbi:hypothetical protein FisN_21Hh237 [Fistulifera solaris]|jgi:predicted kinase|uniref:Uncharacterized protein n=1 Tax=Fistulifera solaris TaxID=1519565 RepID=A0A1Z5KP01_FISSO|nr:hypothetical protein FisN_21Hh237 [Fistulifera solaris]|eukprot:GAX27887.1 hypothetical protein FisN_21Hh237 [Fistulifera solaris]
MEDNYDQEDNDWRTVAPSKRNRVARLQPLPLWFQSLEAPNKETQFEPYILMLMGLPGAGKSTIAEKLHELEPWKYVRVNQDTLKNREACLKVAKKALSENKCPIIDRCHVQFINRKPFYELAESFHVPVDLLIIDAPYSACLERCRRRQNHPTLSPDDAGWVITKFQKDWEMPVGNEKIRQIWTISGIDDPRFPDLFRRLL